MIHNLIYTKICPSRNVNMILFLFYCSYLNSVFYHLYLIYHSLFVLLWSIVIFFLLRSCVNIWIYHLTTFAILLIFSFQLVFRILISNIYVFLMNKPPFPWSKFTFIFIFTVWYFFTMQYLHVFSESILTSKFCTRFFWFFWG